MAKNAVAFMSYVRFDDQHENGRLTTFCERLSGEVRMQTGEKFHIFQDRNDIAWGQQWKERIEGSLDAVTFLVPMITPGFFKSPPCREEFERFLKREKELGRGDLILPVYYVDCPILSDEAKREKDPVAKAIATRQYADWRELRFEPFTSPEVGRTLAKMARQIVEALERGEPEVSPATSQRAPTKRKASKAKTGISGAQLQVDISEATAKPAPGPASKNEPFTWVVDALYRGDHATLTDALNAAQPGDRILVRPGLYKETLVIDKPVEIVGDGELGEVVIEASGQAVVRFKANMSRIANLTLRQNGGGKCFCVDIGQGRLDLEACDITSQSLACVGIYGGADPRLRRNRIHDGQQSGVYVYDNGQGTLEDNDIFANSLHGVEILTNGNPTVRRNRIHDQKHTGVYFYENGQGVLEDNDIFSNWVSGVAIQESGNPMVRRNQIHDQKQAGVHVYDNGQGTIEDNDIFANVLSGVEIKTGGNPTVRRNRIHDGKQSGVYVNEKGLGTIEDNDIFANVLSGVEIKSGGTPTLRRNRIHDSKENGVLVQENGEGTLEDNDIFGNGYSGFEIRTSGNPTICRNRITKNSHTAIRLHNGGGGVIEDNDLRGNAGGAWDIAPDCKDKVKRKGNKE